MAAAAAAGTDLCEAVVCESVAPLLRQDLQLAPRRGVRDARPGQRRRPPPGYAAELPGQRLLLQLQQSRAVSTTPPPHPAATS